jgi:hypothetical protein
VDIWRRVFRSELGDTRKANHLGVGRANNAVQHDHIPLEKHPRHGKGQLTRLRKEASMVPKPESSRRVAPLIDNDLSCGQTMSNTMAKRKADHTDSYK